MRMHRPDFDLRDNWRDIAAWRDTLGLRCYGSIGSGTSSSSAQSSTNQQVAVSGSGVAVGAGARVVSGGGSNFEVSTQGNSTSTINIAGDAAADANYDLAFSTIDHLATAEAAAQQAATNTSSGIASPAPTIVYSPAAATTTTGGLNLTSGEWIGIAALVGGLALILFFKNR